MTRRIDIPPDLIVRAIERAGYVVEEFVASYKPAAKWLIGDRQPTVRQLQDFSKKVRVPFGYLLLKKLPEDHLPIPFFRTATNSTTRNVHPAVHDMVRLLLERQDWLANYLRENGEAPLPFAGRFQLGKVSDDKLAEDIRATLGLSLGWAKSYPNYSQALRGLVSAVEAAGIYVTFNGVVGQNNHRPIPVDVCRGFVLVDKYAPFVFVNNSDYKGAQLFTLMHELVHIWLGESAGFDLRGILPADDPLEQCCNRVAAELLVPASVLLEEWTLTTDFHALAKQFKVSPVVVARRALDLNLINKESYFEFYRTYIAKIELLKKQKSQSDDKVSGNYYNTMGVRLSPRFLSWIDTAVHQGKLTYLNAYRLTGLKGNTYAEMMKRKR